MMLGKRMGSTSHEDFICFYKPTDGLPIIGKLLGHKHTLRAVIAGAASAVGPSG
jgi:hypothetical protein